MIHHVIIVTACYDVDISVDGGSRREHGRHWVERAHRKAIEAFIGVAEVSTPTEGWLNNVRSFMVAPDGSKDNRDESDKGDEARADYVQWLRAQSYGRGEGSPLTWVEVAYGIGEDGEERADAVASG